MTKRDAIIEAAADLFAARGINAVSTKEIARRAKVDEATLFRNFRTKGALVESVVRTSMSRTERMQMRPEVIERNDLFEIAGLYAACTAQRMPPRVMRLYLAACIECPEAVPQRILPMHIAMIKAVRAAQKNGEVIEGDPKEIMAALHDAIYGYSVLEAIGHPITRSASSRRDEIELLCNIWMRGIKRGNASEHSHPLKSS